MTNVTDRAKVRLEAGDDEHGWLRVAIMLAVAAQVAPCSVRSAPLVGDFCGKSYCERCLALAEWEKLFPEDIR